MEAKETEEQHILTTIYPSQEEKQVAWVEAEMEDAEVEQELKQ